MMKIVIKEYTQWKTIIMPTTAVTTSVAPVEEVHRKFYNVLPKYVMHGGHLLYV